MRLYPPESAVPSVNVFVPPSFTVIWKSPSVSCSSMRCRVSSTSTRNFCALFLLSIWKGKSIHEEWECLVYRGRIGDGEHCLPRILAIQGEVVSFETRKREWVSMWMTVMTMDLPRRCECVLWNWYLLYSIWMLAHGHRRCCRWRYWKSRTCRVKK
jgi:hypothetical protein